MLDFTGMLDISIRNTLPDNFGLYAGDSIPDDWQVQYFGINNPKAGAERDPDFDGYDNLFEYHACLIPTDPLSTFHISLATLADRSHAITFSPRLPGCSYTLMASGDLSLWSPVNVTTVNDQGPRRTLIEGPAKSPRRFYRIAVHRD